MIRTIFVTFSGFGQTATLEKYLLSQGIQRDIAAGDSLALTGPQWRRDPQKQTLSIHFHERDSAYRPPPTRC
jgi:hypothetical protein